MLLGLIALVLAAVIIVLWPRGRRVSEPVCGKCSYAVQGLETMTCPECGSDLRAVGIYTPAMRHRLGPFARIVLWSILLPIPAIIITQIVASQIPSQWITSLTVDYTSPDSGSYNALQLNLEGEGLGRIAYQTADVQLTLSDTTTSETLTINIDDMTVLESDSLEKGTTIDASRLAEWMESQGVAGNEAVQVEAAEAMQNLIGFANGSTTASTGSFRGVSSSSSSSNQSVAWFVPAAIAFWALVYLIGAALFYRAGRRATQRT